MSNSNMTPISDNTTRREFLRTSAKLAGAVSLASLPVGQTAHAAGSSSIKIGLVGCGGRGTGAAINAMNAGKDVKLVAMADLFGDWLQTSRENLKKAKGEQVDVRDDCCFTGFDGWKQLLKTDIDVVLIAAASHFHPVMLKGAVEANKHIFCEKPNALDIPGLKIAMAACEEAKKKKLNLVSGLCWRYDYGVRETVKQIQDGVIGDVVAIQENYLGSPYIVRERKPEWSELEYQFRNWYHFNWLSGDQTAQQIIHSIDKSSWIMGDKPPVKAWGMGGRQTCLDPKFGDQFDHQAVVFEYANGVRVFGFTRDQQECHNDTSDWVFGTKGRASIIGHRIEGTKNWKYSGPKPNMYDVEHAELFEAIRNGRVINNGDYACLSSALAIVAQMACYSGEMIAWDEAMQSKRSFALERYDWNASPPVKPDAHGRYPTAMQGKAELEKWQI